MEKERFHVSKEEKSEISAFLKRNKLQRVKVAQLINVHKQRLSHFLNSAEYISIAEYQRLKDWINTYEKNNLRLLS